MTGHLSYDDKLSPKRIKGQRITSHPEERTTESETDKEARLLWERDVRGDWNTVHLRLANILRKYRKLPAEERGDKMDVVRRMVKRYHLERDLANAAKLIGGLDV